MSRYRFLLLVLIVLLTACSSGEPPLPDPLDAFPNGVIRIAVDPSIPPFASYPQPDVVAGIDVDVGRALGESIGLPVEFVPMGVDALYDALLAEQVDVVIAALQFEGWRTSHVRYTQGYIDNGLVLVTDNPALEAMDDLPGYRLAYEFGSPADAHARQWLRRVDAFQTMPYETPAYALDAVRLGQADAALMDFVSARLLLREQVDWNPMLHYVTQQGYVIAVRANNPDTLALLSGTLQTLLEDEVIRRIIDKWL